VVGINTAIYSPNGGSVSVGFAIPSNEAKTIVAKLEKNGSIDHGYLGVEIQPVTSDIADAVGLSQSQGALVAQVSDGTPAAEAGVKAGDIITGFGSQPIKMPKDLSRVVADLTPGMHDKLTVWRDGKSVDLNVTIGGNDGEKQASVESGDGHAHEAKQPSLGIGLADLTQDTRDSLNLPAGVTGAVVASVNPDKPAATAGIQPGDIIVSVNQKPARNAHDVQVSVAEAGKEGRKSVLLLIKRGGAKSFIAVPFAAL
jgi:serine protease Do